MNGRSWKYDTANEHSQQLFAENYFLLKLWKINIPSSSARQHILGQYWTKSEAYEYAVTRFTK